jgi:hypothetical protein
MTSQLETSGVWTWLGWKRYGPAERWPWRGPGRGKGSLGLLLILLGLLAAGVVADFIIENHLIFAPNQVITMFGTKAEVSGLAPVFSAFALGALAVFLVFVGIGVIRGVWGRHHSYKQRIAELEWENTELRSRERLTQVVQAEHERHITKLPEIEEIDVNR